MGIEDREVGADVRISSVLCVLGVFLVSWLTEVDGDSPAERRGQRDRCGGVLCLEVSTLRS